MFSVWCKLYVCCCSTICNITYWTILEWDRTGAGTDGGCCFGYVNLFTASASTMQCFCFVKLTRVMGLNLSIAKPPANPAFIFQGFYDAYLWQATCRWCRDFYGHHRVQKFAYYLCWSAMSYIWLWMSYVWRWVMYDHELLVLMF